jgi:hypothetical protein
MVHGNGNLVATNRSKGMTQMTEMRMEDEDVGERMRWIQGGSSSDVQGWASKVKSENLSTNSGLKNCRSIFLYNQ